MGGIIKIYGHAVTIQRVRILMDKEQIESTPLTYSLLNLKFARKLQHRILNNCFDVSFSSVSLQGNSVGEKILP